MNAAEFTALMVLATTASFTPGPNTTLSTALAGWLAGHGDAVARFDAMTQAR